MINSTVTIPVHAGHVNNLRNRYQNPPTVGNALQVNGLALALHGVQVPSMVNAIENSLSVGNGAQRNRSAASFPRVSVHDTISAIENSASPSTAHRITAFQAHVTGTHIAHATNPRTDVPRIDVPQIEVHPQTEVPQDVTGESTGPRDPLLAQMDTNGMNKETKRHVEQRFAEDHSDVYSPVVGRQQGDAEGRFIILPASENGHLPITPPKSPCLEVNDEVETNQGRDQADMPDAVTIPTDRTAEIERGDIRQEADDPSNEAIRETLQPPGERQYLGPLRQDLSIKTWRETANNAPVRTEGPRELAWGTIRSEVAHQGTGPPDPGFNNRPAILAGASNAHLISTPTQNPVISTSGNHEGAQQHEATAETPQLPGPAITAASEDGDGDGDGDDDDDDDDDGKARESPRGWRCAGDMGTNRSKRRVRCGFSTPSLPTIHCRRSSYRRVAQGPDRGGSARHVTAAGDGDDDKGGQTPEERGCRGCRGSSPVDVKPGADTATILIPGCGGSGGADVEEPGATALTLLRRVAAWSSGLWARIRGMMS